jgi:hypothetical protein
MEELIHEEVLQFNQQLDKDLDQPISVRTKFNISVINGLWSIIAGKRYDLVRGVYHQSHTDITLF